MKLVIIGGVAGGASAAARARRLDEEAEIVVFERGADVSFANCGLPYHIGFQIPERDQLLVASAELFRRRHRLDIRVRCQVEHVDPARKVISVRDLQAGRTYEESYDKLILSPGARPVRPEVAGIDSPRVMTLRDLSDMDRIQETLAGGVRRTLVIGAGLIGVEIAENLVHRGIETILVERDEQILPPFDAEMVGPIAEELRSHGVQLILGDVVQALHDRQSAVSATLRSGQSIQAEAVILCVGVRPENTLAVQAGLEVGPRGGIRVNEFLQTSNPDIFAVGDAIEVWQPFTGEPTQIPLAGPANRQGRIAADNALGRRSRYRGTQGTTIVGVWSKTAASTGLNEKSLQAASRAYRKIYVHPLHHAGYFPGAEPMTLKVLFDPESGKLLGAQAVGGGGVDKRIDVISAALQGGMSVFDLEEMELCYAPQYGSAKDPLNMAGFVAAGLLRGDHPQMTVEELALAASNANCPLVLDVRTSEEFENGHLPEAVNIPIEELRERLAELPQARPVVAYCKVGIRGYLATCVLRHHGYQAWNLSGGYTTYRLMNPQDKNPSQNSATDTEKRSMSQVHG